MTGSEKKIGMLGLAVGSNQYYLTRLRDLYAEKYGLETECAIDIIETDFDAINQHLPDQFEHLVPMLKRYVDIAEQSNITHLLLPNFTLHQTMDRIATDIVLAHPLRHCIEHLEAQNITKVYIFGSAHTMRSAYIIDALHEKGIAVIAPSVQDSGTIDDFRKRVYQEKETTSDIASYKALAKQYAETEPIIIACSELSMYAPRQISGIIDLADLQINSII